MYHNSDNFRITKATLEGVKGVPDIEFEAQPYTVLIGPNGGGKTLTMMALACLTGNEHATHLFDDHSFGRIAVEGMIGNQSFTIEVKDKINGDELDEQKSILPTRTSLFIPTLRKQLYLHGIPDFSRLNDELAHLREENRYLMNNGNKVTPSWGGGFKQMAKIAYCKCLISGPQLFIHPDDHLDWTNKRNMYEGLHNDVRDRKSSQTFIETHNPIAITGVDDKNIITLS